MDADVYLATESGSARINDDTYVFEKGVTRVRRGHPLLKDLPQFFAPAADEVTYELPAKPDKKAKPAKAKKKKTETESEPVASSSGAGLTTASLAGDADAAGKG